MEKQSENKAHPDLISLKELSQLLEPSNWEASYNRIRKRALRGKYKSYVKVKGIGYIDINDPAIPVNIKLKFQHSSLAVKAPSTVIQTTDQSSPETELSKKQMEFALAAAQLVNKFIEFKDQPRYKGSKKEAERKFVKAYNDKAFPDIYEIIGRREVGTLRTWQTKYLAFEKDYRVLAPQYKIKKRSSVTKQEAEVLIYYLLTPNEPLISEVIRDSVSYFEAKRFSDIKSYSTYKRFLEDWINKNIDTYVFYREGKKAFWDKVMPYLPRNWKSIEVGDLLIMDGHHNNYEIKNCFPNKKGVITGKPKRMMTVGAIDGRSQFLAGYEIAPTENVLAIASAFRRAILQLGMVPKYIYIDNGKAFLAKVLTDQDCEMLETLFNRLQVVTIIAKKYHPQSKPIEPFWKWMAELERKMPTYVGTSISKQPPRLHRGEFEHRALYEKAMENITVDIFTAHDAMAVWLDEYHNRKKVDGHLKGVTPAEIFNRGRNTEGILMPDRKTQISVKDLDFLMMDMKVTKLYRNGIKAFGTYYFHEELFGKQVGVGDEIHFRYSLFDKDSIIVFDNQGNRICEAFRWDDFHPIAKMGTEEDQKKLKMGLAIQARLENSVTSQAKKFKVDEIYPFVKKQLKDAEILQLPENNTIEEEHLEKKKGENKRKSFLDGYSLPEDKKNRNIDRISKASGG